MRHVLTDGQRNLNIPLHLVVSCPLLLARPLLAVLVIATFPVVAPGVRGAGSACILSLESLDPRQQTRTLQLDDHHVGSKVVLCCLACDGPILEG